MGGRVPKIGSGRRPLNPTHRRAIAPTNARSSSSWAPHDWIGCPACPSSLEVCRWKPPGQASPGPCPQVGPPCPVELGPGEVVQPLPVRHHWPPEPAHRNRLHARAPSGPRRKHDPRRHRLGVLSAAPKEANTGICGLWHMGGRVPKIGSRRRPLNPTRRRAIAPTNARSSSSWAPHDCIGCPACPSSLEVRRWKPPGQASPEPCPQVGPPCPAELGPGEVVQPLPVRHH